MAGLLRKTVWELSNSRDQDCISIFLSVTFYKLINEFFSLSSGLDLVTTLLVLPTRSVGGTCA